MIFDDDFRAHMPTFGPIVLRSFCILILTERNVFLSVINCHLTVT